MLVDMFMIFNNYTKNSLYMNIVFAIFLYKLQFPAQN